MHTIDFTTDANGALTLGGIRADRLAREYGTPLYVMCEDTVRAAMREYVSAFKSFYPADFEICYASKALCCKEMYRICMQEGLHADVVSGGELATALAAGFPAEKIGFHGNNKTPQELEFAISSGVGLIIVDSLSELAAVEALSEKHGKCTNISLRIKPGIEAHTHDYVKTGQIDSKFGLALENGEADVAVDSAVKCKNVFLKALNSHIGSQIFDAEPFAESARVMLSFIKKIKDEHGKNIELLNLGGGIGIQYVDSDNPISVADHIKLLCAAVTEQCRRLDLPLPSLGIEPGRSIVANAGTTLYTVGCVKEIAGVRNYVSIDGGMTDNPRYALYGSMYTAVVADRAAAPKDYVATVAGKCCESGDLIGENMPIQKPAVGDILAILGTGAYNYSMASNYNRVPRPPVVFVKDGQSRAVVKRETYEDVMSLDV